MKKYNRREHTMKRGDMCMLEKIEKMIEKYIIKPTEGFQENKYIKAIYDSYLSILPIVLVGSFFLALSSLLRFCGQ